MHKNTTCETQAISPEANFEQSLRIKGISLLKTDYSVSVPKRLYLYIKSRKFLRSAEACSTGNTEAMMQLADFFEHLGKHKFFQYAANFWRYRAYLYGNTRAKVWKDAWLRQHPNTRIPSVLDENLSGTVQGDVLHALGFLFFDPKREYFLQGVDENGIVQVCSWCGDEGPDADGFGREEFYDWWCLDEHLTEIPGVPVLDSYSFHERRVLSERFDKQYGQAREVLENRKMHRHEEENREEAPPLTGCRRFLCGGVKKWIEKFKRK